MQHRTFWIVALSLMAGCLVVASLSTAGEHGKAEKAGSVPNLVGTWSGTNYAVIAGETNHKTGQAGKAIFKDHQTVSIVIEKQQGSRFSGQMTSEHDSERLVGFIDPDNATVWMADEDGLIVGKIKDDGTLWYRYLESSKGSVIASYAHFKKQ